jgi:hypothetical protein
MLIYRHAVIFLSFLALKAEEHLQGHDARKLDFLGVFVRGFRLVCIVVGVTMQLCERNWEAFKTF